LKFHSSTNYLVKFLEDTTTEKFLDQTLSIFD
jgi:hypothetical protein